MAEVEEEEEEERVVPGMKRFGSNAFSVASVTAQTDFSVAAAKVRGFIPETGTAGGRDAGVTTWGGWEAGVKTRGG